MMNIYKSLFSRLVITFVVLAGIFLPQSVVAQTVKGRVTDAITGEALIGAAVRVLELPLTGVATNEDGEFSIHLAQSGRYTIETSYVGYEDYVTDETGNMRAWKQDAVVNITDFATGLTGVNIPHEVHFVDERTFGHIDKSTGKFVEDDMGA